LSSDCPHLLAGVNSIFVGAKLLTTPLPGLDKDSKLLSDLGMRPAGADLAANQELVGN
jgi:biotin synthase